MFEARDTLDHTHTHPRTIKALEKDLSLSPQKLKTGFQRLYHTTPGRYVANLRMTQGTLLLCTTDVCVEVISARVGYDTLQTSSRHSGVPTAARPPCTADKNVRRYRTSRPNNCAIMACVNSNRERTASIHGERSEHKPWHHAGRS